MMVNANAFFLPQVGNIDVVISRANIAASASLTLDEAKTFHERLGRAIEVAETPAGEMPEGRK